MFKTSGIAIILLILVTAISCGKKLEKEDSIPREKLVRVYSQLAIINESRISLAEKQARTRKVFEENKITPEEMNSCIEEFKKDPEKWLEFYNDVIKYIDLMEKAEKEEG